MNLYQVLGVQTDASQEEIRKAYRRIARQTHPDLYPDSPEKLSRYRAATEAYNVLGSERSRASYDHKIRAPQSLQDMLNKAVGKRFLSALLPHAPSAQRDGEDLIMNLEERDGHVEVVDPEDSERVLVIPTPHKHQMCRIVGLGAHGSGTGKRGNLIVIPTKEKS